jgi:5-methylthioadenosine/S-adenosylhomocysteine deaminase
MVLALDAADTAGPLSVAVADGRIAALGEPWDLRQRFPAAERFDCAHRLLLPGLVNAHLHPEMHVLKGIVEDMGLHAWASAFPFNRALALLGTREGRWIQRAGIRAALAEALLTGTTRVGTYGVTVGGDMVAAEELAAIGLPGHVTIRDVAFLPARGPGGAPHVPASELRPPRMYRLHAEEALTQSELRAASEAHARGERIVMHAAETRHRITVASKSFGMSTVRLLESYGLLSERVLLSHAVYVDEEERALLAERRVPIVSSPSAEMKLSDGIAPIHDYLARGITVALGTDSAICNNSGDLLLECRQLGLSQKLACGPEALRAGQVLRCATAGGAAALGEASERGTISTGLAADLILLDTRNTRLQPLLHNSEFSNLAANVVYAATGQDVTDVMIGGRWVVRGRKLLTADQDEISAELGRAASRLHERIA